MVGCGRSPDRATHRDRRSPAARTGGQRAWATMTHRRPAVGASAGTNAVCVGARDPRRTRASIISAVLMGSFFSPSTLRGLGDLRSRPVARSGDRPQLALTVRGGSHDRQWRPTPCRLVGRRAGRGLLSSFSYVLAGQSFGPAGQAGRGRGLTLMESLPVVVRFVEKSDGIDGLRKKYQRQDLEDLRGRQFSKWLF